MKRRIIIFILVSLLVFSNYNPIMGKTPKGIMLITETDQYADSYIKRSIVSLHIPQEYHGTGNGEYTVTYGSGDIAYTMNVNSETRTNTWNKGYFRDLQ